MHAFSTLTYCNIFPRKKQYPNTKLLNFPPNIFDELNGMEGILVASKIADRVGITRSVIVNALRNSLRIQLASAALSSTFT